MRGVLAPIIELWNPKFLFRECESHLHTLLKVGLRQERYLSKQEIATLNKSNSRFEQGAIVMSSKRSCKVITSNKKNNNVEQEEQQNNIVKQSNKSK
jgi:hypothetical protein